jgi:hypothetical protein
MWRPASPARRSMGIVVTWVGIFCHIPYLMKVERIIAKAIKTAV